MAKAGNSKSKSRDERRNARDARAVRKFNNKRKQAVKFCIPRASFSRLIRSIFEKYAPGTRIQAVALETMQLAAETYITKLFEDAFLCSLHGKRVTLMVKDLELARKLRKGR